MPGRLQKVAENPLVLADGAHNPDGVRVLAQSLAAVDLPRPVIGVLAIMRDKDYPEMLRRFRPLLNGVVCTQASEARSLTAAELAGAVTAAAARRDRGGCSEPLVEPCPKVALERARAAAGPEGAVLVGGSLYLLEDLREELGAGV